MTILARLTVKGLPARVGSQGRESQMIITTTLISWPQKKQKFHIKELIVQFHVMYLA